MRSFRIPEETVRRLPFYLRVVLGLLARGQQRVSSTQLAECLGVNAWQIRKDFSFFGDFGTRGVGYDLENLSQEIKKILRLETERHAALIGAGNLGSALLTYSGFAQYGLTISAAFDINPARVGATLNGVVIEPVEHISSLSSRDITLAVIAVPEEAAQQVTDALVAAEVRGILNFSSRHLITPEHVKVIAIDIAMDLARLPFYVLSGQAWP